MIWRYEDCFCNTPGWPDTCIYHIWDSHERLDNLAKCLSDAGMLCRSFALGEYLERGKWAGGWRQYNSWVPGCDRSSE